MKFARTITLLAAIASVAGCTTYRAPENSGPATSNSLNSSAASDSTPPTIASVNVTPFTNLSDKWSSDLATVAGGQMDGLYTRLIITPYSKTVDQTTSPDFAYTERGWLGRLLIGTDYAVNLTLSVNAGLFQTTTPLITLEHKSNSEVGEQWTRTVYDVQANFPLFLVRPGLGTDAPTITYELNDTKEYSSTAIAKTIDAALTVANEVAPASKIATTLSAPTLQAKAEAIDTAIGKLFGRSIDEKHVNQAPIRYWNYDTSQVISLAMPMSEDFDQQENKKSFGEWQVSFEEPRPSVFVDWRVCSPKKVTTPNLNSRCTGNVEDAKNKVYSEVDADEVLNEPLTNVAKAGTTASSLGTIGSYLAQQDWYKKALTEFGDASKAATTAQEFCHHVKNTMSAVGLNSIDAGIVVWAVPESPDFPQAGRAAITATEDKAKVCFPLVSPIATAKAPPKK